MQLAERLLEGDVRSLARGISLVEENAPDAAELLQAIYPRTGKASVLGVTGAPGSGKSSLVDRLVGVYRGAGHKVGVVAVGKPGADRAQNVLAGPSGMLWRT